MLKKWLLNVWVKISIKREIAISQTTSKFSLICPTYSPEGGGITILQHNEIENGQEMFLLWIVILITFFSLILLNKVSTRFKKYFTAWTLFLQNLPTDKNWIRKQKNYYKKTLKIYSKFNPILSVFIRFLSNFRIE